MIRGYKYKLNLTKKQENEILTEMDAARVIYNMTLYYVKQLLKDYEEFNKVNPKKDHKYIDYDELSSRLVELKKLPENTKLKNATAEVLQQTVKNLIKGLKKCFKGEGGRPKFKKEKYISVKFVQSLSIDFINKRIKIPKVGHIKFYQNELFEPSINKILSATISYDKLTGFYISLCVDDDKDPTDVKLVKNCTNIVGIDVGIKTYATLSNGKQYENPKYFENDEKKLKKLSKDLSRSVKGSKRYEKKRVRLARWHRKIANKRKDFLNKLTTELVNTYDLICVEDLKISNMMKNRKLSKAIQSCGWGMFFEMLQYKADRKGVIVSQCGTYEPTSKTCSCCGYINKQLKLSERSWECPQCLTKHDRDINAAINIEKRGLVNAPNVEVSRLQEIAKQKSKKAEKLRKREDKKSKITST
jgi:putative transposase